MSVKAGKAFVLLGLDMAPLHKGLKQASARLKAFGGTVRNIGLGITAASTAVAAPLVASVKHFASAGDEMTKMSSRTGVAVEALSQLAYAANQSDVSTEALGAGLRGMARMLTDAAMGGAESTETLKQLGLTIEDLQGLAPEERFKLLADRLSEIEDPSQRAGMAMRVFGKSGEALIPMLEDGAAGIDALMKRADKLGLTMSGEDAKAATEFGDLLSDLIKIVKMAAFNVGAALAPALIDLAKRTIDILVPMGAWIKANKPLIVLVAKIVAASLAAGIAITALGVAIIGVGAVIGGMATILGTVITVLGAILSPIGLVVTAIVGLGAYFLHSAMTIDTAVSWLRDRFTWLRDKVLYVFNGIKNAMIAGEWELAGRIMWLALKVVWLKGVAELQKLLPDWQRSLEAVGEFFVEGWIRATTAVKKVWQQTGNYLKLAWGTVMVALADRFSKFVESMRPAQRSLAVQFAKLAGKMQGLSDAEIKQHIDATIDYNLDAERAEMQRSIAAFKQTVQADADDARKGIDADPEIQRLRAEEAAKLAALEELRATRDKQASDRWMARVNEAEAALNKVKADLAEAIQKAADAAGNVADDADDSFGNLLNRIKAGAGMIDEGMERKGSAQSRGTFNVAALRSLMGGDQTAQRTAKATELTAKNTKAMIDALENSGLVLT